MTSKKLQDIKVPRGYRLVPVNPTVEMLDAAEYQFERSYTGTYTACPHDIWRAMIKAASKSLKKNE
jgi:hypothetical protein